MLWVVISPYRVKFGVAPRGAGPKFKILLLRSFVPNPQSSPK